MLLLAFENIEEMQMEELSSHLHTANWGGTVEGFDVWV